MRRKLLAFVGICTIISFSFSLLRLTRVLFTQHVYEKDFVQFFLMGHALRAGIDLYSPIPVLAAHFDPNLDKWFNVSAYPPIVAVIGLPLSFLPYRWAVFAWIVFELGCLALVSVILLKHFGGRSAPTPVVVTICAFIGSQAVYIELSLGQLMIVILLLLTLSWLALKSGKDFKAGVLLGLVIALKLYAWPIALFLLIKGRWRALISACLVFIVANGAMAAWTSVASVVDYYSRVGSAVVNEYKLDPFNFAAWSIGFRSFGAVGAAIMFLVILLWSLFLALRSKDFDSGFMIMLTAATILQPISWIHYFVTLLPALCLVASRREFRLSDLLLGLFLIALILPRFDPIGYSYPALATWAPFLFVIGLMWLIVPKPVKERSRVTNLAPEAM